jgi:immune inhibitor A
MGRHRKEHVKNGLSSGKRGARRGIGALIVLVAVVPLVITPYAHAQDDKRTAALSWADAPIPSPHRSEADWLVDAGWKTSEEVFGPFSTREYRVGDAERFIPLGSFSSTPKAFVMAYRSDHAYYWFERDTHPDSAALEKAARFFEEHIWPLNTAIYGEEWNPGIDGDRRLHIVNQSSIGGGVMGAFNPEDLCPRFLCPESNQRKIIYTGLDTAPLGSDLYLTTLAHEHQHLIQYHIDGNEDRWFNEGLSQLAEHLNGFEPGLIGDYNVIDFLNEPDHHLNGWSSSVSDLGRYYGAGYLFLVYLYERFGLDFIRLVTHSEYDGLASVQVTLTDMGLDMTVDDVFGDWILANDLDDPYVADGRYYYRTLDLPGQITPVPLTGDAGSYAHTDSVNQYGADYLSIDQPGTYTFSFDGSDEAHIVGTEPHSQDWMWWSYNGANSAARLTAPFDLTSLDTATLAFSAWWNTEADNDWFQVLVSENGGQSWSIVGGQRAALNGKSAPGPYYSGQSMTWIDEQIDLSAYAGTEILVRFEYLTDSTDTRLGVVLDDIGIRESGGLDDVESAVSIWVPEGFLRISDTVIQNWSVSIVVHDADGSAAVYPVRLDALNTGRVTFTVPPDGGATMVIGAMAPFTSCRADYKLSVQLES